MSDLALRTHQRDAAAGIADAQAAADRAAVRSGLATPAQLYRDAIREGRRRPWKQWQVEAARECLRQIKDGPSAPLSVVGTASPFRMRIDAYGLNCLAVQKALEKTDRWRFSRCYPRLRAWAERVLAEVGP